MKTVGVLREIPEQKIVEIGVPVGVVAAIIPTTNPTSTAIFKVLISLKSGNAVVASPHPRAKNCTCYTADLLYRAAIEAGAPEGIIQSLANVTLESTQTLMRHEKTAVILATGGHGLVKAAYSSGKPALGVGPGNTPVLIEKSADVAKAVAGVVEGKKFDYGTVCTSEQALVTCRELREQVLAELMKQKAYLCSQAQGEALGKLLISPKGTVEPKCVGQGPTKIAQMAGFEVPPDTSILAVEVTGVGKEYPLSREKLSPVLSLYFVDGFNSAMDICEDILRFGGLGHTCVIFSNDEARIREFAMRMPASRVLVNTPAPQGSVGLTTNVFPSMTLGCGAAAANATSDNVGPQHLINIKRLAYAVRRTEEVLQVPDTVPAAVPVPASATGVPREMVEAAVERYLAQRGLAAASATVSADTVADIAAGVVDRFLASREPSGPSTPAPAPTCQIPPAAEKPDAGTAAADEIRIVDFVCEKDVREAMEESRKIFIGPKTIVTPAARELAARSDILVLAQRS